jgi:hypothetical protein
MFTKDGTTLVQAPGGLTSYTIPAGVTSIGSYAFSTESFSNLTSITFPATGLASIGNNAFGGCSNISFTTVTIPASVTSIGGEAFSYCTNLVTFIINAKTPPTMIDDSSVFLFSMPSGFTIKVPAGTDSGSGQTYVYHYQHALGWRYFTTPTNTTNYIFSQ